MTAAQTNGHATQVPEGWLVAADLAKKHGGSPRTIQRWGEQGRIGRVKDGQGRAWHDPDDYVRELRAEEQADAADGSAAADVQKTAVLVDGSNALLRQTMAHLEKVLGPSHDATREVFELLREENKSLREQIRELTKVHLENMQAREELISEAHARELELKTFEAREARKQQALEMVKEPAQRLLARVTGGAVAARDTMPASSGKLASARSLLASLSDDQLHMLLSLPMVRDALSDLLGTSILSSEQEGFVREVLV